MTAAARGLRRLARSWTVRAVLLYALLFGVSVAALLGTIYALTVGVIARQIDATVAADIAGLAERYDQGGLAGLVELVHDRIGADRTGESVYFLVDGSFEPVAGNLERWPTRIEQEGRWSSFVIPRTIDADGIVGPGGAIRGISFSLPGSHHLLVGRNLRELQGFEDLILESLVWALAMTGALALIGGFVMSRDMRRRIDAINRATDRIRGGALDQRVPLTGADDEFDRLSANLNAMLGQIEALMAGMREVTDNVAHDLRSPLTRLKARLELTLLQERDPAEMRRAVEGAVADLDQVLGTFNALLSIAQAESGAGAAGFEPVDLRALAADLAELYEPAAAERGLTLDVRLGETGAALGNRHLLSQALANLIDNALKHAAGAGRVLLQAERAGDWIRVTVADDGPGIPEADRERVRQRFVRLDRSRSTPGNGLGLALVEAVAAQHHGRLELADNRPGLRATLVLPRRAAAVRAA